MERPRPKSQTSDMSRHTRYSAIDHIGINKGIYGLIGKTRHDTVNYINNNRKSILTAELDNFGFTITMILMS